MAWRGGAKKSTRGQAPGLVDPTMSTMAELGVKDIKVRGRGCVAALWVLVGVGSWRTQRLAVSVRVRAALTGSLACAAQVAAPPPLFPLINLPTFAWTEHDAYLVKKQRDLEEAMASSAFHVVTAEAKVEIKRYSDRYTNRRTTRVPPSGALGTQLYKPLYPLELAVPPWQKARAKAAAAAAASAAAALRPPKMRRRNSYDEELTVLEQQEGKRAGGDDDDDDGDGDAAVRDVADGVEDFADEDDNDYVVNYYDSDENDAGGADDDGPTFS